MMFLLKFRNIYHTNSIPIRELFQQSSKQHINKFTLRTLSNKIEDYVEMNSSFSQLISKRRCQAKRSILVQVQSSQSHKELFAYCSHYGTVNQMIHYTTGAEPMHFIIVEFSDDSHVKNILNTSCYNDDTQAVPVNSSFLWFRATRRRKLFDTNSQSVVLNVENGNSIKTDEELKELLKNADSVSNQMEILYNATKLNDTGIRLRFLTSNQIEQGLSGMFPSSTALPFGSSVNGYGKMGCDLDLALKWTSSYQKAQGTNQQNQDCLLQDSPDSRLVFQCKAANGSERSQSQRQMETLGDLIQLFLPGCIQVRRILQARVPIIKYNQQLTGVECDLSMTNMTGVHMSELLYLWGEIDSRVKPLVFTIRKWAYEIGLTNSSPGRWITNFSLTLLVLAYLQNPYSSASILPSLNTLVKYSDENDRTISEDGVDCTFLRDLSKLPKTEKPPDSLESLLLQFFEFYSTYDFSQHAVSLNTASSITKPDASPLYIVNPLERGLNVSKNVSLEELEKFKMELRNAAWLLESQESKADRATNWGVLALFESTKQKKMMQQQFYQTLKPQRLMNVKNLFDANEEDVVKYKDANVKQQVAEIKRSTELTIKKLDGASRKKITKIAKKSKR